MKEGRASHTAYTVLQGVVHTGRQSRTQSLVSAEKMAACLSILNSSEEGRKRLKQIQNPVLAAGLMMMQRLLLPGIALHYVTRKKAIETFVRAEIARGARQVVNIGAGFDTLMFELSSAEADLTCIELDHPATAFHKRQAFLSDAPSNLHLCPVDLSSAKLASVLEALAAFDPTAPTCVICEGVLMYLEPSDVAQVFATLRNVISGRLRLVFTATAGLDSPNTNATWLLKRYLHRLGEPLNWTIEQADIPAFLKEQGYSAEHVMGGDELCHEYLSHMSEGPFHKGEFVVSCAPAVQG